MDFLNQAINQMRDLFQSMTPASRVTAVLLVAVIGVSLAYLVQFQSAGPDEFLFNGELLPSTVVDRAEAAIAQAELQDYERVGNRIKVARGKKAEYLAAVAEAGALPPNFHTILESALDLGPFVDEKTRRERLKAAREQQLSMMIRAMEGVEDAKVIYDIGEPRGISRVSLASATVSIQPTPGGALNPHQTKMIKKAVAGAISNLKEDEVVVVNLGDGLPFGDESSPAAFDTQYFQVRVSYEKHMKDSINNLLAFIPGVRVQVTAELDKALSREVHTTTPEGEAAALQETTDIENRETTHLNNGGRVGLVAQGPGRDRNQEDEVTVKNSDNSESTQSNYFIGKKEELLTEAGLVPDHVRAAIAVPTSYLIQVYREKQRRRGADPNEPLPADFETTMEVLKKDVIQSIEGAVAPLLPKEQAEFSYSDVTVSFFETLTPDPIEQPSTGIAALGWVSKHLGTLSMAVVALASLVMLRSLVKSIPTTESSPPAANASLLPMGAIGETETTEDSEEDEPEQERPKLKLKKNVSLRDELADIVREDPDSAAAIVRSWITNAG